MSVAMEVSDIAILAALEWISDRLEERFGRAAAIALTLALVIGTLAAMVAIGWWILS